jgi:hypothetical protein
MIHYVYTIFEDIFRIWSSYAEFWRKWLQFDHLGVRGGAVG